MQNCLITANSFTRRFCTLCCGFSSHSPPHLFLASSVWGTNSDGKRRRGIRIRWASGMNGGLTHFQLLLLTAFSGWLTLCAFTWAFILHYSFYPTSLFHLSLSLSISLSNFYFCLPPIDFINLPLICIFFAVAFGLVDFAFGC